ncbi:MAG: FAD-dependent thymidylate synthase [Candidatus Pacearchaeota archaeon]
MLFNFAEEQRRGYKSYIERIEKGMARELARINLPLSLYTEWYWKIDLHNLFHFLDLRMDEHAQVEIRNYANTILDITKKVAPKACEAFEHYQLNSVKFSYEELKIIKKLLGDTDTEDISLFEDTSFVKDDKGNLTNEGKEFKEKLRRILER